MLYDNDFIESIENDTVSATIQICERARQVVSDQREWNDVSYQAVAEAYALLSEMSECGLLPVQPDFPDLSNDSKQDGPTIWGFLMSVLAMCNAEATKLSMQSLRSRFRTTLGAGFAYEFSQGDMDRVQELINELRELIANTTQLEREHQQRLLRRLEKLQSEMHKKLSDLDRFWGLIGDAGVVLGKIGNDAKPFVDRVREIADIVWQTQSRAEELPSGTRLPSLEHKPSPGSEQV